MAVPVLSMRLIAEERRNRTMTLLMSAPLSMTEIVLGKYLGLLVFLLLPAMLATSMAAALSIGTNLDLGLLATNALGLVLLLATFSAVGLFASSATRHPAVSAVLTLGILLGSWMAGLANPDPASFMQMLSITRRFESFNGGMIDSADLVWHIVAIVALLALTIRRLDRDRLVGQSL
jgi:ABC-2 type transport system permease protein